jgi:hypothetical protein
MAIRHIVMFRFHDFLDEEARMEIVTEIRETAVPEGAIEWRFESSTDTRKGAVIVQNVLFDSQGSFARYRASEIHIQMARTLSNVSNWQIADYEE